MAGGGAGVRHLLAALLLAGAGPAGAVEQTHFWAGLGSLVIPGLGQTAQGRYGAATAHGGLWLATGLGSGALAARDDYLDGDERSSEKRRILFYNRTTYYADLLASVSADTALYSAYDAYYGGSGEPAGDLLASPFRGRFLARPSTWGPLLFRAAGIFVDTGDEWAIVTDDSISPGEIAAANTVRYGGVAVGEEALFRGVVNDRLSRAWGPWLGVPASAVVFGLAHSGRGGSAGVAGASVYGVYLGALHVRNEYRLGEGAALHFWWNFLTAVDYLRNGRDREADFPVLQLGGRF